MIAIIGIEPFGKKLEYHLKQKNVEAEFISQLLGDINFKKLQAHLISCEPVLDDAILISSTNFMQ